MHAVGRYAWYLNSFPYPILYSWLTHFISHARTIASEGVAYEKFIAHTHGQFWERTRSRSFLG